MFGKLTKNLIPVTAIVTSALLGFTGVANAASPTQANSAPVSVDMQQLDERVPTSAVPGLAGLKNGDSVVINDDGSVTGATWSGTYVFHPAGSVVPMAPMYARWKDGLVALTLTPPAVAGQPYPGTLDANWVAVGTDSTGAPMNVQKISTLIPDPTDSSVLRIPDNAWLFRYNSSTGQYTTLVDVFVYQSGDQPLWHSTAADGTSELVANGSQPLPVSAGFWQPQ